MIYFRNHTDLITCLKTIKTSEILPQTISYRGYGNIFLPKPNFTAYSTYYLLIDLFDSHFINNDLCEMEKNIVFTIRGTANLSENFTANRW